MSNKVEDFLTADEEQDIVEAIRVAELNTSGEIRVHIEKTCKGDATNRAIELFHTLKMDNTKLQNAVLIYVAIEDKTFVIFGDKGINDVVENDFWDSTKNIMQSHFKKGDFKDNISMFLKWGSIGSKNYDQKVFNNIWGTFTFGPGNSFYIGTYRGFLRISSDSK